MSRVLILLAILVLAVPAVFARISVSSVEKLRGYTFEHYVKEFSKKYSPTEHARRKVQFEKTLNEIRAHNSISGQLYMKGINHMSDWTHEEMMRLNGLKREMLSKRPASNLQRRYAKQPVEIPAELDYRKNFPPILTAVKDQGMCGSCWAHSATEAMETHYALKTGKLFVMSQQQVSACTPNPHHCGGTGGCGGAVEALGYEYIKEAGGIEQEWTYPYTQYYGDTGKCKTGMIRPVAKVADYTLLTKNDQNELINALVTKGPIAVGVDASAWGNYHSGVFDGCTYNGNATVVNHAVQLIGYGHDDKLNVDYWLIRNSWAADWGEDGYIRLLRTNTPECGWDVHAHDGSACDGDPDIEYVCGMCGILSGSSYPTMW